MNRNTKATQRLLPPWSAFLILALFAVSCRPTVDPVTAEKTRKAREWIRFWPGHSIDWGDTLDNSRWRAVLDGKESVAETMLQATSAVALTEKQAFELAGDFSRSTTNAKPFLIRAVGSHVGTAGFEIHSKKNGDITVIGGALSHHDIPPERRPIVVWLDQPPHDVYLWFSVAE
jgi:hypothetical protein